MATERVRVAVTRPFRYPVRSQRRLAAGSELHVTAEQAAAWERRGLVRVIRAAPAQPAAPDPEPAEGATLTQALLNPAPFDRAAEPAAAEGSPAAGDQAPDAEAPASAEADTPAAAPEPEPAAAKPKATKKGATSAPAGDKPPKG